MPIRTLLLILLCVSLSAIAQITLKSGMSSARVAAAMAGDDGVAAALTIATTPAVIIGLALYGFGAVAWLLVLNKVDVSMAYPFNGIGFILTSALAVMLLGEHVRHPALDRDPARRRRGLSRRDRLTRRRLPLGAGFAADRLADRHPALAPRPADAGKFDALGRLQLHHQPRRRPLRRLHRL